MNFYIVPENIAIANQGRSEQDRGLFFRQDKHGRYVVNTEVSAEWPDIDWDAMQVEALGMEDFPEDENP